MKKVKKYNSREGSALLLVMIVMMIVGIAGMGQLCNAKHAAIEASRSIQYHQFTSLADMGLREFRAITMEEDNRKTFAELNFLSGGSVTPVFKREWVLDDAGRVIGGYKVFVINTGEDDPDRASYIIRSVAYDENEEEKATVESYVRVTSVSEDVWATKDELQVRFVTGDSIWGSIRSNGSFYIYGTPYIDGKAKTSANFNVINGHNSTYVNSSVFHQGVEFNAAEIDFNDQKVTDLASVDGAVTVQNGATIEFLANGNYTVTYSGDASAGGTFAIADIGAGNDDSDNIIYVDGSVTVKGVVKGAVAVAAADNITVDQSIVYASSPGGDSNPSNWGNNMPDDGDRLGLYAVNTVAANGSNGSDVYIHAAVYVTEAGSTIERGFYAVKHGVQMGRPYIHLCGSIVQNLRGAVGHGSGVSTDAGYRKNYHGDSRFRLLPPPGSPVSSPDYFGWKLTRGGV